MHKLLLLCLATVVHARVHSLPEDTHAFPKYRVTFLDDHPVLNETAERWLTQGLRGGVPEFLDQSWEEDSSQTPPQRKEIGSSDTQFDTPATASRSFASANYTIEQMKMGPKDSYLCFVPKVLESASPRQQEEPETDATPARSWSLLQPLSGTCLYHRQGWFTYSYCHNEVVRQFKELVQLQSRLPVSTYGPEEDPDWESYTLGRAPRSAEDTGVDLTVAEKNAEAANLELARNAGSRYLVQRWRDGTICDKTGKPREVEVQFHCSMVMTDHILFVKEAKTCSYVVVIHTPRLCGEPGFKSRRDMGEETLIQCREVVDALPAGQNMATPSALISDQPFKTIQQKTEASPPKARASPSSSSLGDSKHGGSIYNELMKKLASADGLKDVVKDGEVYIEFIDETDGDLFGDHDQLIDALRAAGYDVDVRSHAHDDESMDYGSSSGASRDEEDDTSTPIGQGNFPKLMRDHLDL